MKRALRWFCSSFFTLASFGAFAQSAQPSYEGLWWNAPAGSESGWGLNLTHQGDIIFATWFTYDADGNGLWLVMPDATLQNGMDDSNPYGPGMGMPQAFEYQGTLYRTSGPAFNAATFDPAAVGVTAVGDASLRFTGPNAGTFRYTVNGFAQSKNIVRQVFSILPTCSFGGAPGSNFEGLWWRAPAGSESGWGLNVEQQGDIVFATWFTYDASGRPLWLVLPSATRTADATFSGTLYRTTGPAFNAAAWDGSKVKVTAAGTATLAFTDASNGTFTATVDGMTLAKPITRQIFASPATVCR